MKETLYLVIKDWFWLERRLRIESYRSAHKTLNGAVSKIKNVDCIGCIGRDSVEVYKENSGEGLDFRRVFHSDFDKEGNWQSETMFFVNPVEIEP